MKFMIVFAFLIICCYWTWLMAKQRKTSNMSNEQYYFANRSLNPIMLGFTLMATQVGGGIIVGVCDAAYEVGLLGYCYALGQMLGLLFVYLFFSRAFQRLQLQTVSEIFTVCYNSTKLRKAASILSVISLSLILVAQAVAVKKLFFSLGFTSYWPLCLLWGGVVAYTAMGGFSAVVKTDVLQMVLIFIGMVLLAINIPAADYALATTSISTQLSFDFAQFANYIIWPCCYMVIEQDMIQRFGATRTLKQMRKAILLSVAGVGGFAILPLIMGILASAQDLNLSSQSSVLIEFTKAYLPAGFINITVFILLMAILSTVDSLLCAVSSLIACDNLLPNSCRPESPSKPQDNNYQKNSLITFTIGSLTLIGGIYFESVLNMLVFAYGLTASALFVPAAIGLLGWSQNTWAASFAAMSGGACFCILSYVGQAYSALALVASLIIFMVASIKEREVIPTGKV